MTGIAGICARATTGHAAAREAVGSVRPLLHVLEVYKRIVFCSIELHNIALRKRRCELRVELREVRIVGEEPVAVVHPIRAGYWQAFLIALPTFILCDKLVGNCFSRYPLRNRKRMNSVNVRE
jgi:hypothetical protein